VWVSGHSSAASGLSQIVNNYAYSKLKNILNYKRGRILLQTLIVAELTKAFFTTV